MEAINQSMPLRPYKVSKTDSPILPFINLQDIYKKINMSLSHEAVFSTGVQMSDMVSTLPNKDSNHQIFIRKVVSPPTKSIFYSKHVEGFN